MTCNVHGNRRQKKTSGSTYLHFQLEAKHLDRLITLFAKLEAYDTCTCLYVLVCVIALVCVMKSVLDRILKDTFHFFSLICLLLPSFVCWEFYLWSAD